MAGDDECYTAFSKLFDEVLARVHRDPSGGPCSGGSGAGGGVAVQPTRLAPEEVLDTSDLDPSGRYVLATTIELRRSVAGILLCVPLHWACPVPLRWPPPPVCGPRRLAGPASSTDAHACAVLRCCGVRCGGGGCCVASCGGSQAARRQHGGPPRGRECADGRALRLAARGG
jgi:hypothetical protein